ncbi:MAG: A/G-specific adenine glycosylase [uncultured Acidimicrobiales bacterium]|uniref:Adenine DNA glycosylase n=1 Tax=uncultured Acidimicrobiales bacterium TaxID=310071 RepID=A0A6J4IPQ1_9ACTN|nr:MAG: A/G-specific adenine glycosylase [uncultured Acidimicrobiales bacterium]
MAGWQDDLLAWSARTRRDLPWRDTRDPWAVLVSELMLQQTQVARVVGPYRAFLERFPDPASCATSPSGEVLRMWAGLGYNRRALNLHRAARRCVERHDGRLPSSLPELLALPGVGPYTARAVLAFAYEADVGVVDTNAARVHARLAGGRLAHREVQAAADDAVPPGAGWAWNSAVLDLGATVCTKRSPRCAVCPVTKWCAWWLGGRPDPDPATGSAGTSGTQSSFPGSDREGRGRLVAALCHGTVSDERLAEVMGWPDHSARAERVAAGLLLEGMIHHDQDGWRLPS